MEMTVDDVQKVLTLYGMNALGESSRDSVILVGIEHRSTVDNIDEWLRAMAMEPLMDSYDRWSDPNGLNSCTFPVHTADSFFDIIQTSSRTQAKNTLRRIVMEVISIRTEKIFVAPGIEAFEAEITIAFFLFPRMIPL